jgi:ribonuclease P protein subunit POP4
MSITKKNIHMHELLGLSARIIDTPDKGCIGLKGRIVDETKNTLKIETSGKEKILQKKGTVLAVKIGNDEVNIDASRLRYRPEDRIKKAKKRAILCIALSLQFAIANGTLVFCKQQESER